MYTRKTDKNENVNQCKYSNTLVEILLSSLYRSCTCGQQILAGDNIRTRLLCTEVCNLKKKITSVSYLLKFYLPANNRGLFCCHLQSEIRSVSFPLMLLFLKVVSGCIH